MGKKSSESSMRHTRRSHIKSSQGCETCKRRHIRCDELRPIWYVDYTATAAVTLVNRKHDLVAGLVLTDASERCSKSGFTCQFQQPRSNDSRVAEVKLEDEFGVDLNDGDSWDSPTIGCPGDKLYGIQPSMSEEDRILWPYVYQFERLVETGNHLWVVAFNFHATMMPFAQHVDFVRQSVIACSAVHRGSYEKSLHLMEIGADHTARSIAGLRATMSEFCLENADAVAASSIILAAAARHARDWSVLIRGSSQVLRQMRPWKTTSTISMFLEDQGLDDDPNSTQYEADLPDQIKKDRVVIDALESSLYRLDPHLKAFPRLRSASQNLHLFLKNARISPPSASTEDQFQADRALRTINVIPEPSFLYTADAHPELLVLIAHYEVMTLSFRFLNPWHAFNHLLVPKMLLIEKIHAHVLLMDVAAEYDQDHCTNWANLVKVPYTIAQNFRKNGRIGCLDPIAEVGGFSC